MKEENEKIDFTDVKTKKELSEHDSEVIDNFLDFLTELSPIFSVLKGAKLVKKIITDNLK